MWYCKWCKLDIEEGGLVTIPCPPFDSYDEVQVCPTCFSEDDLEFKNE